MFRPDYDMGTWFFSGIGMLTFALFLSARMGIFQETVYTKHGKHPSEALFYNVGLMLYPNRQIRNHGYELKR